MSKTSVKFILNIFLLLGIFGVIIYVLRHSMGSIFSQIGQTPWFIVLIIFASGLLYQVAEGQNVWLLLDEKYPKFTRFDGMFASCYAAFMRVVTFGAGTIIGELWYYRKKELPLSKGAGLIALRMIFYKGALLIWSFIGLIFLSPQLVASKGLFAVILFGIGATFLIITAILSVSISLKLQVFLVKMAHKILHKEKAREAFDKINLNIYPIRQMILSLIENPSRLRKLIFFNLFKLSFWLVVPFIVLKGQHSDLGFFTSFFYTAFAIILAGVIPTPAGLGSLEVVFTWLFKPLVGQVDAISALLLYRFVTYVLPFLIGMVEGAIFKRKAMKEELEMIKLEKEESSS